MLFILPYMFHRTDFKQIFTFYKFHCVRFDRWNMSTTDALWFVYILSWVLKIQTLKFTAKYHEKALSLTFFI